MHGHRGHRRTDYTPPYIPYHIAQIAYEKSGLINKFIDWAGTISQPHNHFHYPTSYSSLIACHYSEFIEFHLVSLVAMDMGAVFSHVTTIFHVR